MRHVTPAPLVLGWWENSFPGLVIQPLAITCWWTVHVVPEARTSSTLDLSILVNGPGSCSSHGFPQSRLLDWSDAVNASLIRTSAGERCWQLLRLGLSYFKGFSILCINTNVLYTTQIILFITSVKVWVLGSDTAIQWIKLCRRSVQNAAGCDNDYLSHKWCVVPAEH